MYKLCVRLKLNIKFFERKGFVCLNLTSLEDED